jgi:hypothetical protein
VITTALSATELDRAEPRLYARLLDRRTCSMVVLTAPAYRGAARRRPSRH